MKKLLILCLLVLSISEGIGAEDSDILPAPPILGNLQFQWPMTNAKLSSDFGYRANVKPGTPGLVGGVDTSMHFGIDLIPASGTAAEIRRTKILAAEDGVACIVYPAPNGYFKGHRIYGGCVMIRHLVGTYAGKEIYAYTLYGHMKDVWVREGTVIKKGQAIGLMGTTGSSTGPHLHFEILFDPLDFITLTTAMEEERMTRLLEKAEKERLLWLERKGY